MGWKSWEDNNIMDFIYHSNMIEGINIDKDEYTTSSIIPEISGHWKAMKYLVLGFNKEDDLTVQKLLDTHKLLTEKLLWDKAGKYRSCMVRVGNHIPPEPYLVPHLTSNLILDINESGKLSESDIWLFHDRFEIIHPFIDGNGRIGRLLLNYLRLKNGFPLKIVKYQDKYEYYCKIDEARKKLGL